MTIANLKEYARLSMAIKKARQEGKNPTELLIQRQKLIIIGPPRKEPKSRTEINRNYYQRNKEILQEQATINKAKKQEQEQERREQEVKELAAKLYEANSIKVLMSFKQYTELKKGKKLWLDFSQTLQDLTAGVGDIISIMKLREVSENLISDYWATARGKIKAGESWNLLEPEQQAKLIKYWGREKFRLEQGLAAKLEWQADCGQIREREIERAKFHEERGKQGCSCYDCRERKSIRREVKQRYDEYWKGDEKTEAREEEWSDCGSCGEYKKVSVDSGLCRKCEREAEE